MIPRFTGGLADSDRGGVHGSFDRGSASVGGGGQVSVSLLEASFGGQEVLLDGWGDGGYRPRHPNTVWAA